MTLGLTLLTLGLVSTARSEPIQQSRALMGTVVTIAVAVESDRQAERAFKAGFQEFERVAKVMNEWDPDSELSSINAAAGSGKLVAVPSDLCAVLEASVAASKRTGGLFDPTWASLRGLWRFGTDQTEEVPPRSEVERACKRVCYKEVQIVRAAHGAARCRVGLRQTGMKLGLGGVAKGWAVDRAVAALRRLGLTNFFIQAGGDLYAAGKKKGSAWRVGIRDPRGPPNAYFATVDVSDAAFSTSGDYERFFELGGRRYHHIIDPRTCYPALASRSATVLAKSATDAEFVTKAAFIAGGEAGLTLAQKWGAEAVIVSIDNTVFVSNSLRRRVKALRLPTP